MGDSATAVRSSSQAVAIYKGLRVAVHIVDETEISLSRSDLIELINVCILFIVLIYLHIYIDVCSYLNVTYFI